MLIQDMKSCLNDCNYKKWNENKIISSYFGRSENNPKTEIVQAYFKKKTF